MSVEKRNEISAKKYQNLSLDAKLQQIMRINNLGEDRSGNDLAIELEDLDGSFTTLQRIKDNESFKSKVSPQG